ncbi:MAG TPA: hypothetical protein VFA81_09470 [Burkholderiales bacterium]|nr:hypothetical protein [Burkholderiales bacterium]
MRTLISAWPYLLVSTSERFYFLTYALVDLIAFGLALGHLRAKCVALFDRNKLAVLPAQEKHGSTLHCLCT